MTEQIKNIMEDIFETKINSLSDELGPNDIENWDSLGQMKLIVALEEMYKVKFEVSEMFEIFTLGDIKRILKNKGVL